MIEEIAPVAFAACQAAGVAPVAWEDLTPHARETVAADVESVLLDGELSRVHPVFVAVVRAMSAGHPVEELAAL